MMTGVLTNRLNGSAPQAIHPHGFAMPDFYTTKNFPTPAVRLGDWVVCITNVTPALAAEMLGNNSQVQRNLRKRSVMRYANDIAAGYWKLTHQGIAFDTKGNLIDGQHRLNAIIKSNATVKMVIFFGVGDNDEMAVIDVGANRSAADAAKTMGLGIENRHVTIIRSLFGNGYANVTHSQIIELFNTHYDAIVYASSKGYKLGAGVMAAIAAAYYHCDIDSLNRFISVLKLDIPATEPGDRMAILLSKYLHSSGDHHARTRDNTRDIMLKSQRAIQAFMNKENMNHLQAQSKEIYPVPVDGMRAV